VGDTQATARRLLHSCRCRALRVSVGLVRWATRRRPRGGCSTPAVAERCVPACSGVGTTALSSGFPWRLLDSYWRETREAEGKEEEEGEEEGEEEEEEEEERV